MVRFSKDATLCEAKVYDPGEYLFKVYEVKEKVSQAGNDYWQVKFESQDGVKVCDNFMFSGKAATKTLGLLTGLGLADGVNFPDDELETDDILGKFLYIETEKDKDSDFLKCPFDIKKYRVYENKKKAVKKEVDTEEIPF